MRVYLVDWLTVARAGLGAANRDGDGMDQAAGYLDLASVKLRQGLYRQAITDYERCVTLAEQAEWSPGDRRRAQQHRQRLPAARSKFAPLIGVHDG
jgi:hypothetical protein